jgi:hypothetical protein
LMRQRADEELRANQAREALLGRQQTFAEDQARQAAVWQNVIGMSEGKLQAAMPTLGMGLNPIVPDGAVEHGGMFVAPVSQEQQAENAALSQERLVSGRRKAAMGAVKDYLDSPLGNNLSPEDRDAISAFSVFGVQLPQKYREQMQATAFSTLVNPKASPEERQRAASLINQMLDYDTTVASARGATFNPYRALPWEQERKATAIYNKAFAAAKIKAKGAAPTREQIMAEVPAIVAAEGDTMFGVDAMQKIRSGLGGTTGKEDPMDAVLRPVLEAIGRKIQESMAQQQQQQK